MWDDVKDELGKKVKEQREILNVHIKVVPGNGTKYKFKASQPVDLKLSLLLLFAKPCKK